MGNVFTNQPAGLPPLFLSNTVTSVLLDVLVIAGSDRARSDWEKRLVYWLAQHDQLRSGIGIVGFDVEEMGFTSDGLDDEKRFVFSVVDAGLAREGWERLPFAPAEDRLVDALTKLRELVAAFEHGMIRGLREGTWVPDELPSHGICEVHRVYLHEIGCIICNDAPDDAAPATAPHRTRSSSS